jgi:Immunoglobulin I-set domain
LPSSLKDEKEISDLDKHYKINRERFEQGFYELILTEVKHSDAGTFSCVAYNKFGTAKCEAVLMVCDDKDIFGELPDESLAPGEKPQFIWKKDGATFDPEERFKVLVGDDDDSLALVFQHVRPEDAGLYTCVAQTSSGKVSCSAELTVQGAVNQLAREPEKPSLIIESRDAYCTIGGSAMLELQCKGFPKPEIVWKHEGEVIEPKGRYKFLYEDAETMTLIIKGITQEDSGKYTITATNELGEDSSDMNLIVKSPPKIVKPTDYTCMAGEQFKMDIELYGNPTPSVKIFNNGKEIVEDERVKFTMAGNYYLVKFSKTQLSDSGTYSVVASNEMSQTSEFWSFTVKSAPTMTKELQKEVIVDEREDIEFVIKADSYPPPTVKWFKDGKEVNQYDARVKISADGNTYTLKIHGANRNDTGKYTVQLENQYGISTSDSEVHVKCAPQFIQKLTDITVSEGDVNVELHVSCDGYPRPSIKWYIDGMEITSSRKEFTCVEENHDYKLIINEVTTELRGKYSCKVTNQFETIESEAVVTVNCVPKIRKTLSDITIDEGKTLLLEIDVYSVPEPTVAW